METKPNFEQTQKRFDAWWVGEIVDRPPVAISLPAKNPVEWPKSQHATDRERWFDLEFRLRQQEAAVANRRWIADSIPSFHGNLGPEILATLYGAELEYTRDSSWCKPICHRVREVLSLKPNLDTPYWNWQREWMRQSLERGKGKWISAVTDLHTHADLLASLMEPQDLLIELADDYEGVKKVIQHVTPLFDLVYDDSIKPIQAAGQPTMSWLATPHRGRSCVLQADLICMVSPETFQDVFLPPLMYEMNALDASVMHLDGPNALQHLDALLACPRLNAIQWVFGAGNGPAKRWIDIYKRIQAAKKSMVIACEGGIPDALAVAEHLKPNGCFFEVWGSYTEDEVNAFLARMERWAAGGSI